MAILVLLTAAAVALAYTVASPADASPSLFPAGWATGDKPASPYRQQISSDKSFAAADCAPNDVLLFRVRGSGAGYGVGTSKNGQDNLGNWSTALGHALIAKGWSVRDMQAVYSAPAVPLDQIATNFKNASRFPSAASLANAAVRSAAALKKFRDAATNEWRQVRRQLIDAAARCPQRKIVVAGYSQGGTMLRYVVPTLPRPVRDQIVHIDVLADATEDNRVDGAIRHTGPAPARSTGSGIDSYIAKILHGGGQHFVQTIYPADIAHKTIQYCLLHDLVCDANLANFKPQYSAQETTRHTAYPWGAIGTATAQLFQTWSHTPTPTPAPAPGSAPPPGPAPSPGPTPGAVATIGHPQGGPTIGCAFVVVADKAYVVPAGGGTITSFSTQPGPSPAGQMMDFLVLREVGTATDDLHGTYSVVGKTGPVTLSDAPTIQTFPANIPVQAGDILAFYAINNVSNCYGYSDGFVYTSGGPNPNRGDTITISILGGFDLNESADLRR